MQRADDLPLLALAGLWWRRPGCGRRTAHGIASCGARGYRTIDSCLAFPSGTGGEDGDALWHGSDGQALLSPSVAATLLQGRGAGGKGDADTIGRDGASAVPMPFVRRVPLCCGGGSALSSVDEDGNVLLGLEVLAGSWLRGCIDEARTQADSVVRPSSPKRPAFAGVQRRDFRRELQDVLADLVRQQDEVREVSIAAYGNACASRMLARGDELLSAAARGEHRVSDSAPSKEEIQRAANDVAAWVDMDEARKYTADIEALAKLQSSEEEGP